mgnify:CR=1 FL=1
MTEAAFGTVFSGQEPEVLARPVDSLYERMRSDMIERVRAFARSGRNAGDIIPGLRLSVVEQPVREPNCFYVLSVGLILQGRKRLIIGDRRYEYGAGSMIVTSVDMPTSYELLDVRPSEPFVGLSLRLDPSILAELLAEGERVGGVDRDVFHIEHPTDELTEDFNRLLQLLEHPSAAKVRAPTFVRDIHCLALAGAAGEGLKALYGTGTVGERIRRSIRWLRANFRDPVAVEDLAGKAGMAPTTFHKHFKALTSLSPLQYQKRLRLYEAQQFMLRGEGDVNSAAYAVGYRSPQQFNRDYKRLFGTSPGHDVRAARQQFAVAAAD